MAAAAYKVLGQAAPASAGVETTVYTVPVGASAVVSTVTACCLASSGSVLVRLHIRPGGAAVADQHALWRDIRIFAGQTETVTLGLGLAAGTVVSARCSVAGGVAVGIFGTELS